MPPVTSLSLGVQPSWNSRSLSHILLPRSIPPPRLALSPPRRGFFGGLFNGISSLTTLGSILNTITRVWNWIQGRHLRNTMIAQAEVDREFQNHHHEEWVYKGQRVDARMMMILAREKPFLFYHGYVRKHAMGTEERKRIVGVLKMFNPQYYERNKGKLGEAMEWDEVKAVWNTAQQQSEATDGELQDGKM